MTDWHWFRHGADDEVETPGLSFSGRLTVKHRAKGYEVWHKASGKAWPGNGWGDSPWPTDPAWLEVVEIAEEEGRLWYRTVKRVEPGRFHARSLAEMTIECDRLAAERWARDVRE